MIQIRTMLPADLPALEEVYQISDGVQRQEWERKLTPQFLERNPGMSFVAEDLKRGIVGGIFSADTGRRGMIHHLSVHPDCRGHGIGSDLYWAVERSIVECGRSAVAVGIVRENKRDRFCCKVGFDPEKAPLMLQYDLNPSSAFPRAAGLTVRTMTSGDAENVQALFVRSENLHARRIGDAVKNLDRRCAKTALICSAGDQIIAAMLGECSGFRGLIADFAVDPSHRSSEAGTELLNDYLKILAQDGVCRTLAAGHGADDYRNRILQEAGFVALADERIAMKEL